MSMLLIKIKCFSLSLGATTEVIHFLRALADGYSNGCSTGNAILPVLPNPVTKEFSIRANLNPTASNNVSCNMYDPKLDRT